MELNREQIRYKMSEKQIKTALECLSKPNSTPADREKCYFMWKEPSCLSCYHEVSQNALALIKELTEENERLRAVEFTCGWVKPHKVLECPIFDEVEKAKADTVREMHSKIKERCIKGGIYPAFVARTIDQIAKEMMEVNDGTEED